MARFATGYTLLYKVNVDGLAILYMSIAVAWTFILIPGVVCLLRNRHLPFLRIRNVPLSIGAVGCLHVYWMLCMFAYTMNGYFPCSTEFWIMSIYLPLGIALFQAANSQLLYISRMQKKYAQVAAPELKPLPPRPGMLRYLDPRSYCPTNRTVAAIGLGMIVQVR
jgi:hypothetical protein